jgi:hypothetical protein
MFLMWKVAFERSKSVQILTISPWDSNPCPLHHLDQNCARCWNVKGFEVKSAAMVITLKGTLLI